MTIFPCPPTFPVLSSLLYLAVSGLSCSALCLWLWRVNYSVRPVGSGPLPGHRTDPLHWEHSLSHWPTKQVSPTHFSPVRPLSRVRLFVTLWTAARQASLSITNTWSSLKLVFIESVMPSNHIIFCQPLILLPSIFTSIRAFSNESALCIRWPKCWSFSFNISPSNEHSGQISIRMDWLDLLAG